MDTQTATPTTARKPGKRELMRQQREGYLLAELINDQLEVIGATVRAFYSSVDQQMYFVDRDSRDIVTEVAALLRVAEVGHSLFAIVFNASIGRPITL